MNHHARSLLLVTSLAVGAFGAGCSSKSGSFGGSGASGAGGAATGAHASSSGVSGASGASGTGAGATGSTGAGVGAGSVASAGGTGVGGGSVTFDGGPPACAASAAGDTPTGTDPSAPGSIKAFTYTNVGSAGKYDKVVDGWSKATGCVSDPSGALCDSTYRMPVAVSGAMTPFDEDLSMVFAGPMELYQIAVYTPSTTSATGAWEQRAYWDRCTTQGLAFVGNKAWYECGGFVQSYVSADGTQSSASPVQFSGSIAAGTQVNVMSDGTCTGTACGWSSGLALDGFAGGSKIFVTKLRMPISTTTPAYWILPGQVMRSSQYGCNCRLEGCDATYQGGCGELDVVEVTGGVATTLVASTSIYSYQGCFGGVGQWDRPVNETATFAVIFDATSKQIGIRRMGATDFAFDSTLPSATVTAWLADQGTTRAMP